MTIRCQIGKTLDRVNHEDSLGIRVPESVVRLHTGYYYYYDYYYHSFIC